MRTRVELMACLGWLTTVCACGSPNTFTLKDAKGLKVGQSKSSEYRALLGEPKVVSKQTTAQGTFETVRYSKVVDEFSGDCLRLLVLEFKDDVLNACFAASSCSDETTIADTQAAVGVRNGLGQIGREGVVTALGEPSGRAHCPSTLGEYEDICAQSPQTAEIWSWASVPKRGYFTNEFRTAIVLVAFDSNGKPVDVQVQEMQRQGH